MTVSVTDEDSPNPPTAGDPCCHAARTSTNNPPPLCAYVTVIITPDTRRPPTGPSIPAQVATRGRAFSYTVPEFDDPDGPAVIYQASQADGSVLPAWLAFNTTTGTFSGTPPTTGRIDIRVTVTDTAYPPSTVSVTFPLTVRAPVTRPPGGGGGGGGGGPRTSLPSAVRNLMVAGGNGQVVLTWDAPSSDGGAEITDYEYRINGSGPWISIGSTETTHTVTGLVNGREYTFQVRAVNRVGKGGISNRAEATPVLFTLDFAHFADGDGTSSDLVFVNVGTHPIRPALAFYDQEGQPMAPESVAGDHRRSGDPGGRQPEHPDGDRAPGLNARLRPTAKGSWCRDRCGWSRSGPSAASCALISRTSAWPGWELVRPSATPSSRSAAGREESTPGWRSTTWNRARRSSGAN